MPRATSKLLVAGLAVCGGLATLFLAAYLNRYQPFADIVRESESDPYASVSIVMEDATVLRRLSPGETLRLHAREVQVSHDRQYITASGITRSQIEDAAGRTLLAFSAGQTVIDAQSRLLGGPFRGNVVVSRGASVSSPAFPRPTASCDSLTWDSQSDDVLIPGTLTLTLPGYNATASGQGLLYNVQSGDMEISRVHGAFRLPKNF